MKTYLTRNGLLASDGVRHFFLKNTFDFVRMCGTDEFDYLTNTIGLVEISGTHKGRCIPLVTDLPFVSKWHHLAEIVVNIDENNFKPETSNNVVNYRFTTYRDFWTRKVEDVWQFCYLDRVATSADFSHDELTGNFTNQLTTLMIQDTTVQKSYVVERDYSECYRLEVLEKLAKMISPPHMLETQKVYIAPGGEAHWAPAFTDDEKQALLTRLDLIVKAYETAKRHHSRRN